MQIAPPDLEIHIRAIALGTDSRLQYILNSPSGALDFYHHTIRSPRLESSLDRYQAKLLKQLGSLSDAHDAPMRLERLGRRLYHELFPVEMRQAYRRFREVKAVLIVSDENWIPWELLKPFDDSIDDDFIGCRFELTRWIAGERPPAAAIRVARLAGISGETPPGEELRRLAELAGRYPGTEMTTLSGTSYHELSDLLRRGSQDLLHFTCHGRFDEVQPDSFRLQLAEGSLRASHLQGRIGTALSRKRPLVFFNTCRAAEPARRSVGLGGWTAAWIRAGVGAFVGPLWNVDDRLAQDFAEVFYEALIEQGQSFGQAARSARLRLRELAPHDPAWLTYQVYAHPNSRLELESDKKPLRWASIGSRTRSTRSPSPLLLPHREWLPDRSPPDTLLRADYEVVPFHGRERELADLDAWCHGRESVAIHLDTGIGGMGKTRLARELCKRLCAEGWQAGFVDPSRPALATWQLLHEIGSPSLLVIDHAETRRELLSPLLREVSRAEGKTVRVLLLARAALDWWEQLKTEDKDVGELLYGPATSKRALPPLASSPAQRAESYRIAGLAFAALLGEEPPAAPLEGLDAPHFERVLLLHMSALAAFDAAEAQGEVGLLDHILDREFRFWKRLATARGLPKDIIPGLGRAMAVITMAGGTDSERQTVEMLGKLDFFQEEKQQLLLGAVKLLHELYPANDGWIAPVMPDLLGEHLIQREMEIDANELLNLVLGPKAA